MSSAQTTHPFVRKTYLLGIINGSLIIGAMPLLNVGMVFSVFVKRLAESASVTGVASVVGLAAAIYQVGYFWPQVFISNLVEPRARKKPFYVFSAALRILAFGGVIAALFLVDPARPGLLLCFVVGLLFLFSSGIGFGLIPFMDIISKAIPPNRRGRFMGARRFWGGLLGLGGGLLARYVLDEQRSGLAFPANYRLLFCLAYLLIVIGACTFLFAEEPIRPVQSRRISMRQQFLRGWRSLARDRNFRRFAIARVLMASSTIAAPFYAIYWIEVLQETDSLVGILVAIGVVSAMISNVVWSRVADAKGNKLLLVIGFGCALLLPLGSLLISLLPDLTLLSTGSYRLGLHVAACYTLFALAGFARDAAIIAQSNYVLEIAPERRRPTFMAVSYTLIMPCLFLPCLGGLLADRVAGGMQIIFALAVLAIGSALFTALGLKEPRDEAEEP